MSSQAHAAGRRALALSACITAMIGFAAGDAKAAVSARVVAGTLQIAGDGASDRIALRLQAGAPGTLLVDTGSAELSFDRETFAAIDVDAGAGADEVRIDESAGAIDEEITADGGAGGDVLAVVGSNAADRINAFALKGRLQVTRALGATFLDAAGFERVGIAVRGGVDIVNVDDLTATGVKNADVDLGGGDNLPDFVVVRATAARDNLTVGSVGKGGVAFTGLAWEVQVLGAEETRDNLTLLAQGGDDSIAGGVGVGGPERVIVEGGEGTDTMTYRGTRAADRIGVDAAGIRVRATALATTSQEAAVERFVVQGLDGADVITASDSLAGLMLDGGSGADVLEVVGTESNDKLDFSANGPRVRVVRTDATTTIDVADVERAAVAALGGPDVVIVNDLAGTALRTVDADLGAGDGAIDTVLQRGTDRADAIGVTRSGAQVLSTGLAAQTRITGSEPADDALRISTLAGDDDVAVAANVRELIDTIVDLGADD